MKLSPDDIRRARSVNLIELLIGLGHKPVSRRPDHALFHSPLRDDRHPSFSVSRVNGAWVWYDFFWRLHIMDYAGGEDFNGTLLRLASLTALGLVLAGAVLAVLALRRRWRISRKARRA